MKRRPTNNGSADIRIGTSGWHYEHWRGRFYPERVKGYGELSFYAEHFDTVENNSSFYRTAGAATYETWNKKTPDGFVFSLKLNRFVTHIKRLKLDDETKERTKSILAGLAPLGGKLGAIVIQLPASFKPDLPRLRSFLSFFTKESRKLDHPPDVAIEFRSAGWFDESVYALLRKYNVALVAADSSRYPGAREVTADFAYIRFHGPGKLFASPYSKEELEEWSRYIKRISRETKRVYVYFNNDFEGYALGNARELKALFG